MKKSMKTSEILIAAKEVISTHEKWTQGEYARNAEGYPVLLPNYDTEAVCFCSLGAIAKVAGTFHSVAVSILRRALPFSHNRVGEYNDAFDRSHSQIMKLFDDAIALAKEEEERKKSLILQSSL